jgi:ketosteroid isomerase-like protein
MYPVEIMMQQELDVAAELRRKTAEFERGINEGKLADVIERYYGDEYLALNLPEYRLDRTTWRAQLLRTLGAVPMTTAIHPRDIAVGGDIAVVHGDYQVCYTVPGQAEPTTVRNRYVEVWRLTPAGGWRVWWGLNAPAPSASPRQR